MDNITSTNTTVNYPNIIAFHVLFMIFTTIPIMIVANAAIVISIILEKSLSTQIRIVFANIPIAGIIGGSGLFINHLVTLAFVGSDEENQPPEVICDFVFIGVRTGSSGRLSFMALYAITVLLIVRFKAARLKPVYLIITVASVWVFIILNTFWFLVPSAIGSIFIPSSCIPVQDSGFIGLELTIIYLLIFGLGCFSISVIVPIITLCYTKKHMVTEDSKINTALAKFSFFLLIGNTLNIVGGLIPIIIASTATASFGYNDESVNISFFAMFLETIGLIPTPVITLLYFKNIRKRLFPCLNRAKQETTTSGTTSGTTS